MASACLMAGALGMRLRIDAIKVALRILLVEFREGLCWRGVPRGRYEAELGHALHQFAHALAHGRKVLVQVGRDFGQVMTLGRLGGQAEAGADGVDLLQASATVA